MDLLDFALPSHPEEWLLVDLVAVLLTGVLFAMVARRLGQSPVIGYLLAGVVLGPGALGLVSSVEAFPIIGEVGVALLLFTVGLELSWTSLRHSSALPWRSATLQVAATLAATVAVGLLAGAGTATAVVVGMIVALSSTAVVLRVLAERAETDSYHGRVALAILLVQDVMAVAFLLLVPVLGDGSTGVDVVVAFGAAAIKLALVVAVMVALDRLVVRRLFRHASSASERELLVVLSLAVALGAAGATDVLGLSPMVGAFVAGLLIGDAEYSDQVHAEIGPLRTALIVVFFAFVGMTVDLGWLVTHVPMVVLAVVATVSLKIAITAGTLRALGHEWRHALLAAVVVSQLGEFSLVVAAAAAQFELIDVDLQQLVISTAFLTIMLTPPAIAAAVARAHRAQPATDRDAAPGRRDHVIVVGHGPTGELVVDELAALGALIVIIELNPTLVRGTDAGYQVVMGDAGRTEILHAADVATAKLVVVTVPDPTGAVRVVRQVRALAPNVPIIARCRYHRSAPRLIEAGATDVIDEEVATASDLFERATDVLDQASSGRS